MTYQISLEVFEGPMDLLLHLIRKNKLDIYDIPISLITDQYLEYIEAMKELDIEVASEFVVTASTLLAIKAKMLLPKHDDLEEEEEEDPRLELVQRLLEYQQYKSVVDIFKELETQSARVYAKPVDEELVQELAQKVNPLENISFEQLTSLFKDVMERVPEEEEFHEIARSVLTIGDVMKSVTKIISQKKEIYFQDILPQRLTRYEIVIYFLAILELIRKETMIVRQAENFGPIKLIYIEER
ncbi:segregation/condensation protein A [Clostridia bacterium]|nr:segregation/condensation protein A [Clostridia bacterium]